MFSPSPAKYLASLFISASCKILPDYSDWSKQINSLTKNLVVQLQPAPVEESTQELIMLNVNTIWRGVLFLEKKVLSKSEINE